MKRYRENPKTKGSGVVAAIPQQGRCPRECSDCFFQSGRSFLNPIEDNTPNMPEQIDFQVVRVNDGNDSNNDKDKVISDTRHFLHKFYNTAIPDLTGFNAPVVLTVNPAEMTDFTFHLVPDAPKNLMFVRFRTNTWNLDVLEKCIEHYSSIEVPIVLTFMAYYSRTSIKSGHGENYAFRKRTMNSYNAITTAAWERIMMKYRYNKWVHSCGKIEGEEGDTHCRFCGNCLREYFATLVRMNETCFQL